MGTTYSISIQSQKAVNAGKSFCHGRCYRGIYSRGKYYGQLEVVVDEPGQYNGIDNKWVDVSYIDRSRVEASLEFLSAMGFKGCPALIIEEDDAGSSLRQQELCALII